MQNSLKHKGFTHEFAYNESHRLDTFRLEFGHFKTLKPLSIVIPEKIRFGSKVSVAAACRVLRYVLLKFSLTARQSIW